MQEAVKIASAIQAERASVEALRQEAMQSAQQRQHDMALQLEAANTRANRSALYCPHQAEITHLLCAEQHCIILCPSVVMQDKTTPVSCVVASHKCCLLCETCTGRASQHQRESHL
jgi:hypothetical protein